MFQPDRETEKIIDEVSRETKVNAIEVKKVIDLFYGGSSHITQKEEPAHIRWPFLGTLFMNAYALKKHEANNS